MKKQAIIAAPSLARKYFEVALVLVILQAQNREIARPVSRKTNTRRFSTGIPINSELMAPGRD